VFLTIKASGSSIYTEKGSKFLAIAVGCCTPKQALDKIARLEKKIQDVFMFVMPIGLELKKHNSDLVTMGSQPIVPVLQYSDKLSLQT
jgi:putative IMPACT (imprinted ancient) family translation regulator